MIDRRESKRNENNSREKKRQFNEMLKMKKMEDR